MDKDDPGFTFTADMRDAVNIWMRDQEKELQRNLPAQNSRNSEFLEQYKNKWGTLGARLALILNFGVHHRKEQPFVVYIQQLKAVQKPQGTTYAFAARNRSAIALRKLYSDWVMELNRDSSTNRELKNANVELTEDAAGRSLLGEGVIRTAIDQFTNPASGVEAFEGLFTNSHEYVRVAKRTKNRLIVRLTIDAWQKLQSSVMIEFPLPKPKQRVIGILTKYLDLEARSRQIPALPQSKLPHAAQYLLVDIEVEPELKEAISALAVRGYSLEDVVEAIVLNYLGSIKA